MKVLVHREVEKKLKWYFRKNRQTYQRVIGAIQRYARDGEGDVGVVMGQRKLGEVPLLRLRAGVIRIHFAVKGSEMRVGWIGPREEAYQPWILEVARRRLRELGFQNESSSL